VGIARRWPITGSNGRPRRVRGSRASFPLASGERGYFGFRNQQRSPADIHEEPAVVPRRAHETFPKGRLHGVADGESHSLRQFSTTPARTRQCEYRESATLVGEYKTARRPLMQVAENDT